MARSMEEASRKKNPKMNIIDGTLILVVLVFLVMKFLNSGFFLFVLLVSVPFAIYAVKIIVLDGLLAK